MNRKIENIEINGVIAPAILYKYRSFHDELHKNILYKRELYLSSPNDFEDKKDCNLEEKIPPKEQLFEEYLKHIPKELQNASNEEKERYARYMAKHGLYAHPEAVQRMANQINGETNKQRGVLSLSKRWNNEYMWENYGDRHRGFCVGFNTKALIETNLFDGGGEASYYYELPLLSYDGPIDLNIIDNLSAKKKDYEKEEEYRLFKIWYHIPTTAERTITIPSECFECIIMGKDMTENDKKQIREIHMNSFPHARLF